MGLFFHFFYYAFTTSISLCDTFGIAVCLGRALELQRQLVSEFAHI